MLRNEASSKAFGYLIASIAAAVAFFSLERKETKVQERSDASARRPYFRPAASFGMAIALFFVMKYFNTFKNR